MFDETDPAFPNINSEAIMTKVKESDTPTTLAMGLRTVTVLLTDIKHPLIKNFNVHILQ